MGILGRMKDALSSKATAAIDAVGDPARQLEAAIRELEDAHRQGMQELLGYKTSDKQLQGEIGRLDEKVATWEKRAMDAVRAGNDELARTALREKRAAEAERLRVQRDRAEAQSYAIELNRSRKLVETRLAMLKLRKGTIAQNIAAARSGGAGPLATGELFESLAKAERAVDEQTIETEVDAMLSAQEADAGAAAQAHDKIAAQVARADAEEQLAALKAKMAAAAKKKP